MEKSDSIKNLAGALIAFQMKCDKIKKDATNPYFKKKYASLSKIQEQIQIALAESGLCISQHPCAGNTLATLLMHESGEFLLSDFDMHPVPEYVKEKDSTGKVIWRSEESHYTPQAVGSAITYAKRYAIVAVLGLNIDEDDDGHAATHPPASEPKQYEDDGKPWLNEGTKEYKGAVQKLKAGTTTIAKIKTVMKIGKATEAKLIAESKNK